jgi:hypothetical protein
MKDPAVLVDSIQTAGFISGFLDKFGERDINELVIRISFRTPLPDLQ